MLKIKINVRISNDALFIIYKKEILSKNEKW